MGELPAPIACHEDHYSVLLARKRSAAISLLANALPQCTLPPARTYESARKHFRAKVWFDTLCLLNPKGTIEYFSRHH